MTIGHFLNGIAALIWDPKSGQYLLLRRSKDKDFARGDWECVTGRVDQGESYTQALQREVREETDAQVQIEFMLGTTHFYRGAERPENELLGVLYGCTLQSTTPLHLSAEHSEMRWCSAQEALDLVHPEHWLRGVIARAELLRAHLPAEVKEDYHQHGFEI